MKKKQSNFKLLVSEFNKLEINENFTESLLLNKINQNIKENKMILKNLHNYILRMIKAKYISKIDENNFVKNKNLPDSDDYSSFDLDIESRRIN